MLPYKISLTYGDPCSDGHGMSATDYYMSSHTTKQIADAVNKAERAGNFNFKDDFCSEYEDPTLTDEQYDLLSELGIDLSNYVEEDPDFRYAKDFTGLYLAIAKTQLPELATRYIKDDSDNIEIGGYGMFSN